MTLQLILSSLYLISVFVGQGVSYGKIYFFHIASLLYIGFLLVHWRELKFFIEKNLKYYLLISAVITSFLISFIFGYLSQPNISTYPILQYVQGFSILLLLPLAGRFLGKELFVRIIFFLAATHLILSLLETIDLLRWPLSPFSQYAQNFEKFTKQDYDYSSYAHKMFIPATSFFWNPNNSALVTLTIIPLIGMTKDVWLRFFFISTSFFVIFFSDSKSILVLSLVIVLMWGASLVIAQKKSHKIFWLLTVFASLFSLQFIPAVRLSATVLLDYFFSLIYLIQTMVTGERFDDLLVHEMIRERLVLIDASFSHFKSKFFFGVGIGYLYDKVFWYENRYLKLASIHNTFIEILIEGGILSLSSVVVFVSYVGMRARKNLPLLMILFISLLALPVLSTARYFLYFYGLIAAVYFVSITSDENTSF